MAVATHYDVAVALGRPITSDAEQEQVQWWLSGVELLIGAKLGDLTALNQAVLKYVEVEAVVAKVRRGDSRVSSKTVSIDDGSVTERFETGVQTSDISDDWWALLNPSVGSGFYSTRPGFETDTVRSPVSTPPAWPADGWHSW